MTGDSFRLHDWAAIKDQFGDGCILGNGASICFSDQLRYPSLYAAGKKHGFLGTAEDSVFQHLGTSDFESVLRMLWHAQHINRALKINESRVREAYEKVRAALIETVRAVHPDHGSVEASFSQATEFLLQFRTVASLNYDLTLYWSILSHNDSSTNRFKDCFVNGEFRFDWKSLREPYRPGQSSTLVFYPHGNLVLAREIHGVESKVHSSVGRGLLDELVSKWSSGSSLPLFVSEGTSAQKQTAIRGSPYLSKVLEEVLPDLCGSDERRSVVVFGWSMSDQDDHLLEAICRGRPRRWAVSMLPGTIDVQDMCLQVEKRIRKFMAGSPFDVSFFESSTCWVRP